MLVVVEDRDAERLPQLLLDVETVGRADVFQVDPADGGLEQLAKPDHLCRTLGRHLEIEHVDVGERLEQDPLALHHRFAGERADVAEAQHGRPVGHDRHEVAFGGIGVRVLRPLGDLEARLGHPRRVGEGQVALVLEGLGRRNLDLARAALCVVIEGLLAAARQGQKSFLEKELC